MIRSQPIPKAHSCLPYVSLNSKAHQYHSYSLKHLRNNKTNTNHHQYPFSTTWIVNCSLSSPFLTAFLYPPKASFSIAQSYFSSNTPSSSNINTNHDSHHNVKDLTDSSLGSSEKIQKKQRKPTPPSSSLKNTSAFLLRAAFLPSSETTHRQAKRTLVNPLPLLVLQHKQHQVDGFATFLNKSVASSTSHPTMNSSLVSSPILTSSSVPSSFVQDPVSTLTAFQKETKPTLPLTKRTPSSSSMSTQTTPTTRIKTLVRKEIPRSFLTTPMPSHPNLFQSLHPPISTNRSSSSSSSSSFNPTDSTTFPRNPPTSSFLFKSHASMKANARKSRTPFKKEKPNNYRSPHFFDPTVTSNQPITASKRIQDSLNRILKTQRLTTFPKHLDPTLSSSSSASSSLDSFVRTSPKLTSSSQASSNLSNFISKLSYPYQSSSSSDSHSHGHSHSSHTSMPSKEFYRHESRFNPSSSSSSSYSSSRSNVRTSSSSTKMYQGQTGRGKPPSHSTSRSTFHRNNATPMIPKNATLPFHIDQPPSLSNLNFFANPLALHPLYLPKHSSSSSSSDSLSSNNSSTDMSYSEDKNEGAKAWTLGEYHDLSLPSSLASKLTSEQHQVLQNVMFTLNGNRTYDWNAKKQTLGVIVEWVSNQQIKANEVV